MMIGPNVPIAAGVPLKIPPLKLSQPGLPLIEKDGAGKPVTVAVYE
jgi:hypothetical protein